VLVLGLVLVTKILLVHRRTKQNDNIRLHKNRYTHMTNITSNITIYDFVYNIINKNSKK